MAPPTINESPDRSARTALLEPERSARSDALESERSARTTSLEPERSARSDALESERSARTTSLESERSARTDALEPVPAEITVEEMDQEVAARVQAFIDELAVSAEPSAEIAEVRDWWDVAAFGPLQLIQPTSPLLPHRVIKVGEEAFVYAIIMLNPSQLLPLGTNAADVLSRFALPYEVRFQTGNLTTWSLAPANMQAVQTGNLVPGQQFYLERIRFVANRPGLYEMNITARLLGATPPHQNAPRFAGYATTVFGLDAPDLFGTTPSGPLRFQVYA